MGVPGPGRTLHIKKDDPAATRMHVREAISGTYVHKQLVQAPRSSPCCRRSLG
jgi:hypothetical protein